MYASAKSVALREPLQRSNLLYGAIFKSVSYSYSIIRNDCYATQKQTAETQAVYSNVKIIGPLATCYIICITVNRIIYYV